MNLLSQRPEQNSAKKKPDRSCSAQTQQGLGGQTGFNENRRIEDGGFGRGPSLLAAGCASSCAQPQARLFGMVADEVTRPAPPGNVPAPASSRRPLPVSENAWVHVLGHRWQKFFYFSCLFLLFCGQLLSRCSLSPISPNLLYHPKGRGFRLSASKHSRSTAEHSDQLSMAPGGRGCVTTQVAAQSDSAQPPLGSSFLRSNRLTGIPA